MRRILAVMLMLAMTGSMAVAAAPYSKAPAMPRVLANGRYVYVRAYDGDQFNPQLLPEDRQAINSVQDALQKWGHYTVVYRPSEADVILVVQSRPSEDVLAAYDARNPSEYLWRVMGENGLQKNETPLVNTFEQAVDKASTGNAR